jgi:hypothetical protein
MALMQHFQELIRTRPRNGRSGVRVRLINPYLARLFPYIARFVFHASGLRLRGAPSEALQFYILRNDSG